jgi:hypothetical protein
MESARGDHAGQAIEDPNYKLDSAILSFTNWCNHVVSQPE